MILIIFMMRYYEHTPLISAVIFKQLTLVFKSQPALLKTCTDVVLTWFSLMLHKRQHDRIILRSYYIKQLTSSYYNCIMLDSLRYTWQLPMWNIILLQAHWINNSHRPLKEPSSSLYKVPHTLLCAQINFKNEKQMNRKKWNSWRKTLHHFTKAVETKLPILCHICTFLICHNTVTLKWQSATHCISNSES